MAQPFRHAFIIKTLQNSFKRNPIYHWNDCYSELFCCASTLFHNTQHFYLTSGNYFFMAAFQEPVSTHTCSKQHTTLIIFQVCILCAISELSAQNWLNCICQTNWQATWIFVCILACILCKEWLMPSGEKKVKFVSNFRNVH